MKHPPVDPFYLKYGRRLKRARKLARLTQEVASGLLAMGQANLSRLETGRQAITLKDLKRFSEEYHVPFEHLVSDHSPLDDEEEAGQKL